jgi:hypothetical protein
LAADFRLALWRRLCRADFFAALFFAVFLAFLVRLFFAIASSPDSVEDRACKAAAELFQMLSRRGRPKGQENRRHDGQFTHLLAGLELRANP